MEKERADAKQLIKGTTSWAIDWLQKAKEREKAKIATARVSVNSLENGYVSVFIWPYF